MIFFCSFSWNCLNISGHFDWNRKKKERLESRPESYSLKDKHHFINSSTFPTCNMCFVVLSLFLKWTFVWFLIVCLILYHCHCVSWRVCPDWMFEVWGCDQQWEQSCSSCPSVSDSTGSFVTSSQSVHCCTLLSVAGYLDNFISECMNCNPVWRLTRGGDWTWALFPPNWEGIKRLREKCCD